jgi:GTPase SAR1 family protein
LGETGVGKSTFINAFVNYLKFETLEQAERGEPVVLIPVSFLLTRGDQFDEFIVKFGNDDINEDHEHEGQSVTQQCKSYVFDINDRLRLRFIDTPGIGDTRGVTQDIKNIDHILTYINTLPYLNAVCLLLKPNASRLNVFFRSCVRQLLTYLTPIGFNNIIFCFTNSRSTFYAPGDTGRLLREMLNQENLNDIPFGKENTFCFDSESFRYLAARKCDLDFDDYQKTECKNSWNGAVTESVRLLNFVQTREPYYLEAWQSPRKAALDITMFARPLMETLRLIIYNWKLTEAKLVFKQIILNSNPVAIELCTHCAQANIEEVGPFWIMQYQPAPIKTNTNQHHLCPLDDKHFLIEAIIQHELADEAPGLKIERWQNSFHNFLLKCDRIQHFLRQQGPSAQEDPFAPILERFLEEEQQISQIRNINSIMNRRVREVLQSIKQIRQQNSQQLFESNERLSLREVYQIIDEFARIPTVKTQIDSIKRSRQLIMNTHERRISADLIKNKTFTT